MKQKATFWIVLGFVVEKILQHGLSALFFTINIDWIGTPDIGNRIPLSDPVMAVLNCIVMGLFIRGFWDIWKFRIRGLHLVIILAFFDIIAEFIFHGVGFITVSVIVAIFLISFAFALKRSIQAENEFGKTWSSTAPRKIDQNIGLISRNSWIKRASSSSQYDLQFVVKHCS